MAESNEAQRKRGAQPIAELIGRVIDPLTRKRGFATADLISAWPDIAGSRFAAVTRPAKIVWPRGEANEGAAGVLTLHVEGPSAILVQHEVGQILERVNAFLGYQAVGQIRIVQAPVAQPKRRRARPETVLPPGEEARLASATGGVADAGLRAALERLGRGVLGRPVTGRSRQTP
jgi:hypothetical protein